MIYDNTNNMEKESFIFYRDWRDAVAAFEPAIRLELYEAVMAYAFGEPLPALSPAVQMAFNIVRQQLDRDASKYERIVERNRQNGARGGRPKKTQENPKNPMGYLETQKTQRNPKNPAKPKKADNDNDIIIQDNNNIYNNNLSTTTTTTTTNAHTHTHEGFIPVADIPAYILKQKGTAQFEAMQRELYRMQGGKMAGDERLNELLALFVDANNLQGVEEHDAKDIFPHFIAWARIYMQAQQAKQERQKAGRTLQGVTLRSDEGKQYRKF